jgi:hypothetical protein
VYAEKAPMQRLLPSYLALYLQERLREEGIEPIKERLVTDLRFNVDVGHVELVLQGWEKQAVQTDYIVLASTHIEPKVDIAQVNSLYLLQCVCSIDTDGGAGSSGNSSICSTDYRHVLSVQQQQRRQHVQYTCNRLSVVLTEDNFVC